MEDARNVANRHKVHSSTGQGDPQLCSLPNWVQNSTNLFCAEEYVRLVEAANPSTRNWRHCSSRAEWVVLALPTVIEGSPLDWHLPLVQEDERSATESETRHQQFYSGDLERVEHEK